MVQLSATRCSCVAILSASLVSFGAITICAASQRVFTTTTTTTTTTTAAAAAAYFVIDSVRKLLDTHSYPKSELRRGPKCK
jgi:hypothetical protein